MKRRVLNWKNEAIAGGFARILSEIFFSVRLNSDLCYLTKMREDDSSNEKLKYEHFRKH